MNAGNEKMGPNPLREACLLASIMLNLVSFTYLRHMFADDDSHFLALLLFLPALPGLSFQKDILRRLSSSRARICIAAIAIPGLICAAMIVSGSVQVMRDSILMAGIGCVGSFIVTVSVCLLGAGIVPPDSVDIWRAVKPSEDVRSGHKPPFF